MLNQLRSLTKTWIAGGLIALLVASFAIWGVADIFTAQTPNAVSVVGRDQISILEYSVEFERELSRLAEQSDGQIGRDMAVQLGVHQAVLDRLALRSAISQKTRSLGLVASDRELAEALHAIPAFIDPITGEFSADLARGLLAQNGLTEDQFTNEIELEIVQGQLFGVLGSGLRPPDLLTGARLKFMGETRALSVVAIPASAAAEPAEPTPEELAAFYAEREIAYVTPPRRAFSFATLALDDFIADAPVDEALVLDTFEAQQDALRTPERRDVVEIAAPDEGVAREVARRLRAGEDAAAIAEDLELAPPNTYDDALPADLLTQALAEAAFAVAQGETTDPVDGGIAWFVARVDQVTAGAEQSFEEARPEIERQLASDAASEMLFDAVDAFEQARSRGADLEAAAAAAQVPMFSYGPVESSGAAEDAPTASQLAAHPEILAAAFSSEAVEGVTGELLPLGDEGYLVMRLDRSIPAAPRPLEEVEAQVRAQYALTKRAEALDALAETARTALAGAATPSDAAATVAGDARGEISELRRDQATPTLSRELLARAFAAPVGDIVIGGLPDGGRVVVRVDDVRPAADVPADQLEATREPLSLEILDDVALLYQQAVQAAYPRRDDPNLLAQAAGVSTTAP